MATGVRYPKTSSSENLCIGLGCGTPTNIQSVVMATDTLQNLTALDFLGVNITLKI